MTPPLWASDLFAKLDPSGQNKERGPGKWTVPCPIHQDCRPSLDLDLKPDTKYGERILLCCRVCGTNATSDAILHAVGLDWKACVPPLSNARNGHHAEHLLGCTLTQYAEAKQLPVRFLCGMGLSDATYSNAPAVRVPYRNTPGKDVAIRFRRAIHKPAHGDDTRFAWRKGSRLCLYGLDRLQAARDAGSVVIVEGESDCHTLWFHGIPALGLPGAGNWKEERDAVHLDGIPTIYIIIEPDAGGASVRKWVDRSSIRERVKFVTLPCKDPSALHMRSVKEFKEHWRFALDAAVPWTPPVPPDQGQAYEGKRGNGRNLTDLGNAERLIDAYGTDLRYCVTWSQWLVWNGRYWQPDETGEINRLAKKTVRGIYQEAAQCDDDARCRAMGKHAVSSETASRVAAMILLARYEVGIPVEADSLDTNPFLLCCENGTLNLKTGRLQPHRREDLITKCVNAPYDPSATCPQWYAHIERFLPDPDVRAFLRRACGYTLTGDVSERVCFIMHGTGSNGKSVLIETLAAMMGKYAMRTPVETLMTKRDGGIPNDVARLKGARLVHASETEEGKRLAESFVKEITGGDTVSARFMRGEWFDFKPELKLWLRTNHKPVIRGTDQAIWDRLPLIPFMVRIPDEEKRPLRDVMDELRAEMPGILAWAVSGCQEWLKTGLAMPAAVRAATETYRSEMDTLGSFMEDRCILGHYEVNSSLLYDAYKAWCEASGEYCGSQKWLGGRLTERGFDRYKRSGAYWWRGLGLTDDSKGPSGPLGPKNDISSENDFYEAVIVKNGPDGPDGPLDEELNEPDPFADEEIGVEA
jgi:putative DNA primase/helicase